MDPPAENEAVDSRVLAVNECVGSVLFAVVEHLTFGKHVASTKKVGLMERQRLAECKPRFEAPSRIAGLIRQSQQLRSDFMRRGQVAVHKMVDIQTAQDRYQLGRSRDGSA